MCVFVCVHVCLPLSIGFLPIIPLLCVCVSVMCAYVVCVCAYVVCVRVLVCVTCVHVQSRYHISAVECVETNACDLQAFHIS